MSDIVDRLRQLSAYECPLRAPCAADFVANDAKAEIERLRGQVAALAEEVGAWRAKPMAEQLAKAAAEMAKLRGQVKTLRDVCKLVAMEVTDAADWVDSIGSLQRNARAALEATR